MPSSRPGSMASSMAKNRADNTAKITSIRNKSLYSTQTSIGPRSLRDLHNPRYANRRLIGAIVFSFIKKLIKLLLRVNHNECITRTCLMCRICLLRPRRLLGVCLLCPIKIQYWLLHLNP